MMSRWLPCLLLLLAACQPSGPRQPTIPASDTSASADILHEPNISQLHSNLLDSFAAHRQDDTFAMWDDTYMRYWGAAHFPPYGIDIGHLFSPKAIHAVLFYSDEWGSGVSVYRKQDGKWTKILEDDSIDVGERMTTPEYKDWNNDGIHDLYIFHPSAIMMSVIDRGSVWLMDGALDTLHYVSAFFEIENPEVDSATGLVVGSLYYHGEKTTIYRFRKYKLVKLSEKWVRE